MLLLIPGINLLHEFFLGSVGFDSDLAFAALLILGALIGFRIRSRTADSILAGAMIVVISTYLFLEYGTISAIPSWIEALSPSRRFCATTENSYSDSSADLLSTQMRSKRSSGQ